VSPAPHAAPRAALRAALCAALCAAPRVTRAELPAEEGAAEEGAAEGGAAEGGAAEEGAAEGGAEEGAEAARGRARAAARRRLTVGPFAQGRPQLSLGAGRAQLNGGEFFTIQAQAGLFVLDGLLASLGAQYWLSRSALPSGYLLAPGLTYYAYALHPVAPYAGVLYQRVWIDLPLSSPDAVGARLGAALRVGGAGLLSGGARYMRPLSCAPSAPCGEWAPEVSLQLGF